MCFFRKQQSTSQTVTAPAEPPPVKSSADIQAEAEKERQDLGYSYRGLAATILTAGLGDTSKPTTSGIVLGGY